MSEMNSFQDAFYIMAKELGFDYAQPLSPREVFETQMLPRIKELVATQPAAGEPVYQLRNTVANIGWRDADKEAYDSAANMAKYERRILWTAPPAAAPVAAGKPVAEMISHPKGKQLIFLVNGEVELPVGTKLYKGASPAAALGDARTEEHEHIGYMDPTALFGLLAGSDTTTTISSAIPSLIQPIPTPPENWAVPIYVVRRPGVQP